MRTHLWVLPEAFLQGENFRRRNAICLAGIKIRRGEGTEAPNVVNPWMRSLLRRILGGSEDSTSPPLLSRTGRLRLRAPEPRDRAQLALWLSDHESCRLAFGVDTDEETLTEMSREYLQELVSDPRGVLWIEDAASGLGLGFLRYKLFRKERQSLARIGIMVGESTRRGQGLGTEALSTLLLYLFEARGVDLVELDTASFNRAAQRCFLGCGFEVIREVEIVGLHNRWTEQRVIMRLTRRRWQETLPASTDPPSPEADPPPLAPH